jgi:DNA-binding protein H-NS
MANDLKTMSKKQLEKMLKDVQGALAGIAKKEKREAKKAAEKAAAKFGFSLSELTGETAPAKKPRKAAAKKQGVAKYANPENSAQTWTGKGRQPQWYKAAIDAGKDPKSLEV